MSDQYTPTTEEVRDAADYGEITPAEFERWLNAVQAEAWDEAKREVAMIPCWADPETGLHGFDLHNETEQGARIAVMEVLDNNPYREQETP